MYQPYFQIDGDRWVPFEVNGVQVFFRSSEDAYQFCGCHIEPLGIEVRKIQCRQFAG